MEETKRFISFE